MMTANDPTAGGYLLLVDDDLTVHFLNRFVLRDVGYGGDVCEAMDGTQAMEVIEERGRPLLMVLDLRMPCMDGHEVLERLGQSPPEAVPPVVVLTSSSLPEDRARCEQFEFVRAFIEKPLRSSALKQVADTVPLLSECLGPAR